jgi:uncharacterized RDD family membrane protein YckC
MQWTDNVTIETPEQIDVSLEVAGLGSRFLARLYDWTLKWLFMAALGLLGLAMISLVGAVSQGATYFLTAALIAIGYIFFLGYDLYFLVRRNGQTPGKKAAGIRVIKDGGAPVDFSAACLRSLIALVDFLPCFYFLGGLLVLLNAKGQRLGDMAAGTLVIRERVASLPGNPLEAIDGLASDDYAFTAEQLAGCAAGDRHILRSFFQRYRKMDSRPRQKLAQHLADEFTRKTAFTHTTSIEDGRVALVFLASLYRDMEKLAQQGR